MDVSQWPTSIVVNPETKKVFLLSFLGVVTVFDGDTVLLDNGEKVRLLGINTPEVEGRNKMLQKGGEEARQWLQNRLEGEKVRLLKDLTSKDKYGRTLAHLFSEDGGHINLELVREGYAAVNIYPPDLLFTDELVAAQQQAEAKYLGIWQYSEYAPKTIQSISRKQYKGWQRLQGRVQKISASRKYIYLNFSKHLSARIAKKNLPLFPDLQVYENKQIEIRGWLTRSKQKFSMLLRHPSSIKIL